MIGIYKITNLINGKVYIGQSVNIEKRFIAHKNTAFNPNYVGYNYPLYRAIRKYGIDNFSFEVLEECLVDELNTKEIWYVAQYQAHSKMGYNQDDGGDQASHYIKLSDELVSKIIMRLKTSLDNSDEIGEEFGVSGRTIRNINSGEYCYRETETYPIRPPLWTLEENDSMGIVQINNRHYCRICGAKITTKNSLCVECAHKTQRKANRPEPLELAKMVKEHGFTNTGKLFGVDGNTIKKWCKSYGIPYLKNELIHWYNEQCGIEDTPNIKKENPSNVKQVKQINPTTNEVLHIFESENAAARSLGKKKGSHIGEACRGILDIAYGFKWEYVEC